MRYHKTAFLSLTPLLAVFAAFYLAPVEAFVMRPVGYVADSITPNLYVYLTAARDANYACAGALAILIAIVIFAMSGAFLRRLGSR
jgi:hypothetical protein